DRRGGRQPGLRSGCPHHAGTGRVRRQRTGPQRRGAGRGTPHGGVAGRLGPVERVNREQGCLSRVQPSPTTRRCARREPARWGDRPSSEVFAGSAVVPTARAPPVIFRANTVIRLVFANVDPMFTSR